MSYFRYPVRTVATLSGAGLATETKQDDIIAALGGGLSDIDFMDNGKLDASVTTIPKSSSNPVEIIASLAANCTIIEVTQDVGEYIGLYTGAAASEVLHTNLWIGGDQISNVNLPLGSRISIGAIEDTDIVLGSITINFKG